MSGENGNNPTSIRRMAISELAAAPYNPRKISPQALAGLTASIDRFGMVQPIVVNSRTGNVVGGHQRLKVLQTRGDTETDVVVVDLPETEERALNVALNNPHIAGDFTEDLQSVLEGIKFEDEELFADLKLDELWKEDKGEKYSQEVESPIYKPSGECPDISEIYNVEKEEELNRAIEESGVTDDQKRFLRAAATRHIVVNYAKCAEYYSHVGEEMQRLMEDSALVIIDFGKAIEDGFVRLEEAVRDSFVKENPDEE